VDSGGGRRTARGGRQAAWTDPTFDFTMQGPDWRRNESVRGFCKKYIYTRRLTSISCWREYDICVIIFMLLLCDLNRFLH
jgi:hypothetical protein